MSNPQFSQAQIDGFLKTLTTWAKSLPADQQAMLNQVLVRAKTDLSLSDEQLNSVVGGLRTVLTSLRLPVMEGEWMQWQARQY
jgi:hypothetical protein